MNQSWIADALPYGQTLCAQSKPPKTRNALITKELVRPAGLEPAAFCSGDKGSMCILLISIAAMTAYRANRWRIKAAVDERLMKGLSGDQLSKSP